MNIVAHLLAGVAALIIGFLWYHPKTFGTAWMRGVGMTDEKMGSGNMALRYGLTFLMAFVISVYIAYFASGHEEKVLSRFQHFAFHGFQLGGVVVMPIMVIISLFEQLNFKTIAINVGYWIVTLTAMGAIIGAMGPA